MVPGRSGAIFMAIFGRGLPIGNSESPEAAFHVPDTVGS